MLILAPILVEAATKRFSTFEPIKKRQAQLLSRRFQEYLLLLEMRFRELDLANYELANNPELVGATRSLQDIQFSFLERTEAFHEQVYASLASFTSFLSDYLGHEDRRGSHLGSSIGKFLKSAENLISEPYNRDALVTLDASRSFRDKYIIHPQLHARHDWMTHGDGYNTTLIYFTIDYTKIDPKDDGLPVLFALAPPKGTVFWDLEYRQFLQASYPWLGDVYIPPFYKEVYEAIRSVIADIVTHK
ncbi:MAG: hypothetical protein PHC53_01715 [Patescibacteria group bacterium]|nr:hypothetical protein [Patescibacteria group bacterium]